MCLCPCVSVCVCVWRTWNVLKVLYIHHLSFCQNFHCAFGMCWFVDFTFGITSSHMMWRHFFGFAYEWAAKREKILIQSSHMWCVMHEANITIFSSMVFFICSIWCSLFKQFRCENKLLFCYFIVQFWLFAFISKDQCTVYTPEQRHLFVSHRLKKHLLVLWPWWQMDLSGNMVSDFESLTGARRLLCSHFEHSTFGIQNILAWGWWNSVLSFGKLETPSHHF